MKKYQAPEVQIIETGVSEYILQQSLPVGTNETVKGEDALSKEDNIWDGLWD